MQRLRLKHQLFAIHYLACGLNGAQAARSAGYSHKNARQYASRLLTKANVKEFLAVRTKAAFDRINAAAEAERAEFQRLWAKHEERERGHARAQHKVAQFHARTNLTKANVGKANASGTGKP